MNNQPFSISDQILVDHLACPYKAYLKVIHHPPSPSVFLQLQARIRAEYDEQAQGHLSRKYRKIVNLNNGALTRAEVTQKYDLILGASLKAEDCVSYPSALQLTRYHDDPIPRYAPIRFAHGSHPTNIDRTLVTYDAFLLSRLLKHPLQNGAIIYSSNFRRITVQVSAHVNRLSKILSSLRNQVTNPSEPAHILNRHCDTCDFQGYCQAKAQKADHLSLLSGMSEAEIARHGEKGIFTVHQLSYTFRPRKPRKRAKHPSNPHHFSLQALALREGKVYIHGTPCLPKSNNRIYFDIEGMNDRAFYYLIGVTIVEDGNLQHHYYWSDTALNQISMFEDFVDCVQRYEGWPLLHFGDYETKAMKSIFSHLDEEYSEALDRILKNSFNILSVIHSNIYFPVHRNGLKDIAHYLSYRWTANAASGQMSVCWRTEWERSRKQSLKNRLIEYNRQDCEALRHVVEFIYTACERREVGAFDNGDIVHTESLDYGKARRHKFGKANFALEDWDYINKCAYFDYQRDHVFVRTDKQFRAISRRSTLRKKTRRPRPTARLELTCNKCPHCNSRKLALLASRHRQIVDLKFYSTGARRWIGHYTIWRYRCQKCGEKVSHPNAPQLRTKFGHGLMSWFVYQHLVCGQNMLQIHKGLRDVFGLQISYPQLHRFKSRAAEFYEDTYTAIQKDIVRGRVVHIDETPVKLWKEQGYVWVLTSLDRVYYLYRESREASFLPELLNNFSGVLVSDFFTGYDSLKCKQQKCLIHLIRDINEDVLGYPFDEELKLFSHRFGTLLRNIVKTIDRYGLKKRHLKKHRSEAMNFLERVCLEDATSLALQKYQKRFRRSGDKMFTFLEHDGVPWNNNNAEHAIKVFARYRRFSDGRFTEKTLREFLLLLSVFQTCEYNHIPVLRFLLSQVAVIPRE